MPRFTKPSALLGFAISSYMLLSAFVFNIFDYTAKIVIDEEFHIPQGLRYCAGNMSYHDPKITTFPGLYLASKLFVSSTVGCSTFTLRAMNIFANAFNILLCYYIRQARSKDTETRPWKNVLTAFNTAFFPPLYFFSFLYYTDVLSMTFLLCLYLCYLYKYPLTAFLSACCAIMMRQSNVVWVVMFVTLYAVEEFVFFVNNRLRRQQPDRDEAILNIEKVVQFKDIEDIVVNWEERLPLVLKMKVTYLLHVVFELLPAYFLIVFIFWNRSVVLGDRSAHYPGLHFPQILYFAVFFMCFSVGHFFGSLFKVLKMFWFNKVLTILVFDLCIFSIYFFTHEHPYLLADNRHYMFYIWQRFYQRYEFFRYYMIPVYVVCLYSLWHGLTSNGDVNYAIQFFVYTIIGLCLQRLIEIRYFIPPFILAKLHFRKYTDASTWIDFAMYWVINAFTIYIFATKEVKWNNYDEAQRIIW